MAVQHNLPVLEMRRNQVELRRARLNPITRNGRFSRYRQLHNQLQLCEVSQQPVRPQTPLGGKNACLAGRFRRTSRYPARHLGNVGFGMQHVIAIF